MKEYVEFRPAFIGIASFISGPAIAYDYWKCVEIIRDASVDPETGERGSVDDAIEMLEFNYVGAYLGDNTPVFVDNSLAFEDLDLEG